MEIVRCVNLDWLECYCLEPDSTPRDAEYFTSQGWQVVKRDYGTRVFDEMFTLYENGTYEPLIEIRRKPKLAASNKKQVIDPRACHIRLHNRTCYFENAAYIIYQFIETYNFVFMRIKRVDICLDFELFDSGDNPERFLSRVLAKKYSKINVCDILVHGIDRWDGQTWNSASWGSKKSDINTKLYCKSLELAQVKDKPYIRQAWARAGLVDDFIKLTKRKQTKAGEITYKPVIWRLEFSIQSSVKKWFVIEDNSQAKTQKRSVYNTLDMYFSKQQLLDLFASLVEHYFHFKKHTRDEHGNIKRKDRCEDKKLFDFTREQQFFYKVERVASTGEDKQVDDVLQRHLESYKILKMGNSKIQDATDTLLAELERDHVNVARAYPADSNEITLLRQLLSSSVEARKKGQTVDIPAILAFLKHYAPNAFGEVMQGKKGDTIVSPSDFQSEP